MIIGPFRLTLILFLLIQSSVLQAGTLELIGFEAQADDYVPVKITSQGSIENKDLAARGITATVSQYNPKKGLISLTITDPKSVLETVTINDHRTSQSFTQRTYTKTNNKGNSTIAFKNRGGYNDQSVLKFKFKNTQKSFLSTDPHIKLRLKDERLIGMTRWRYLGDSFKDDKGTDLGLYRDGWRTIDRLYTQDKGVLELDIPFAPPAMDISQLRNIKGTIELVSDVNESLTFRPQKSGIHEIVINDKKIEVKVEKFQNGEVKFGFKDPSGYVISIKPNFKALKKKPSSVHTNRLTLNNSKTFALSVNTDEIAAIAFDIQYRNENPNVLKVPVDIDVIDIKPKSLASF